MNNISKRLLILLPIILIIQIANAQTGNDCGCGEYPASVIVETVGDPCAPPDLGNDDGSLKSVYEHECCMKKCKENRVNAQSTDIRTKTEITPSQNNATLTNKDLTKKLRGSQNQQTVNQNDLNQRLTESLTTTFNQISEGWAKERDFQNKISSLTNIKSVDATSIITEAKNKAQQINVSYSQKKNEALNQSVNATQNLIKSAENEEQAVAGSVIGTVGTVISQSNLEKQRKEAQEKLEKEKEYALKRIAKEITDKYNPIKDKHLEAAIYAVQKDKEEYHLANYEYAKCMAENAYDIVVKDMQCEKPTISKPIKNHSYTGQDYFNSYKRKSKNLITEINQNAEYFLELAIEKEPNNENWLFEKVLQPTIDRKTKIILLNQCLKQNSENNDYQILVEKYKNEYTSLYKWESQKNNISNEIENEEIINRINKKRNLTIEKRFENYGFRKHRTLKNKGYYIVYKRKKFGISDSVGNLVVPIKYERIETNYFTDTNALLVIEKKKYGLMNTNGEFLISPSYDYLRVINDNLVVIKKDKKQFLLDRKGNVLSEVNPEYYIKNTLNKNESTIQFNSNMRAGLINIKGEVILQPKFKSMTLFKNKRAIVTNENGKFSLIDEIGNKIGNKDFDELSSLTNSTLYKVKSGDKYNIIDTNCNSIFSEGFDSISLGYLHIILQVKRKNKLGLITVLGDEILPTEYDKIIVYGKKSFVVKYKNKYLFFDYIGNLLGKYDNIDFYTGHSNKNNNDIYHFNGIDIAFNEKGGKVQLE